MIPGISEIVIRFPQIAWFSTLEYWLIGAVAVLAFMIWRLTRHQECDFDWKPEGEITDLLHALAGLTHSELVEGNAVDIIRGPKFFQEVVGEMDRAEYSIHLETFMWHDGKASDLVSDALCRAASRGVDVRLLADARGSSDLTSESREKLRNAGCQLQIFRPWTPMHLGRFNLRDHRKIIVIDGRTAFVGGHCITDRWIENHDDKPAYTDLTARIKGPIVRSVQSVFAENWIGVDSELFASPREFPDLPAAGRVKGHVASTRPDGCPSAVQVLHHLAIAMANEKLRIQNPYFLPDPPGVEALCSAAKRGVDVRIMVPSVEAIDSFFVAYASHSVYAKLLGAGVRIFEFQPTLLHQKIITVDGKWTGIGSSNFDDRSFEINDEITVGLLDEATTAELDRVFEDNVADCVEIDPEKWSHRPLVDKLRERFFVFFKEQF